MKMASPHTPLRKPSDGSTPKLSCMMLGFVFGLYHDFLRNKDLAAFQRAYDEKLALVKKCGFDTVDIGMETMAFGVEETLNMLKKHRLGVACFLYFNRFSASDEEGFKQRIEDTKRAIDFAKSVRSPLFMLVPTLDEKTSTLPPQEALHNLSKHFAPILAYAEQKGIGVCVEDMPFLPLRLCKSEDLTFLFKRHPQLLMIYDTANMLFEKEEPIAYYRKFQEKIRHIHFKDIQPVDSLAYADRDCDGKGYVNTLVGEGCVDLAAIVKTIKQSGYDGYVTVELPYIEQSPEEKTKRSRDITLQLFQEVTL